MLMEPAIPRRIVHVGEFHTTEKIKQKVMDVITSEKISEGPEVLNFEKKWARYIGTKFSITANSGTSALIAGLEAIKVKFPTKKTTKILTTPLTYIATTNAIVLTGFTPVFIDVDPETFCISVELLEKTLEQLKDPSTVSMILPVHLLGFPADMDKINQIGKKYGLLVMEDAAQAHGTIYHGKKVGSLSDLSAFSFYIAHNIQAGELGAVNTNDKEISQLVRQIKSNGRMCNCIICTRAQGKCPYRDADFDPRFTHNLIGYNFKAMEFQAAIANVQMEDIDAIIKARQQNVQRLNEILQDYTGVFQLPKYSLDVSYLAYPVVIRDTKLFPQKIRMTLELNGVETRPIFGCIPTQQPAYSYLKREYDGKVPVAEHVGKFGFYIGCHQYLTEEDFEIISKGFKKIESIL